MINNRNKNEASQTGKEEEKSKTATVPSFTSTIENGWQKFKEETKAEA